MSERLHGIKYTAHEVMELHTEAMCTHDLNQRLLRINEPWPGSGPAPRMFLGRTIAGTTISRFRVDLPEPLVDQLKVLSVKEPAMADLQEKPAYFHDYIAILQGQRITMGPCFAFPVRPKHSEQVVRIDRGNAELLQGGFEWALSEVDYAQPFVALVCDGKAVSICRSVRITPQAHEAGLETLEAYRGRGYASSAAAGWAAAVRERGALPLYSTSWDNAASRSVAKKLGLILYGAAFTLA